MVSIRTFRLVSLAACAAVWGAAVLPAVAWGGQPLVLDTQRGISDGQSGIVLQSAPLSQAPMVAAQRPAAPAGLAADESPPLIVAPYIKVPGTSTRPGTKRPSRPQTQPDQ